MNPSAGWNSTGTGQYVMSKKDREKFTLLFLYYQILI